MQNFKITSTLNPAQWSSFVYDHPNGNIFQTPEMYEVYKNTKNYEPIFLAVIDDKNEILGTLLAVIQKEYSGFLGSFTARSIIYGGPLIKDNNPDVLDLIVKEYDKIIKRKAIYSQFRNMWDWGELKEIFIKNGFEYEEHLNILVDLTIGEELLWKGVKKSRKEGIRKAIRNELKFSTFSTKDAKDVLPIFYKLLKETYLNAKLPYPLIDFFYNLNDKMTDKHIKYFTLRKNEETIIVLVALIYKECLFAFYIGTKQDKEILRMRPVDLFYWEVMRWGIVNGIKVFDWLGAGKPNKEYGVRDFKLEYGGKVVEFGRYEKIHKPFLMEIGKIGLKLWQKLK